MAEAGQVRHKPGRHWKPGQGRLYLHALPPWQPLSSWNPWVSTCPAASLPCWGFRGEARTRSRCWQVPRPRRSLPVALSDPPADPQVGTPQASLAAGASTRLEGLWLRKSRPGTSGPARLPAAPAQPPLKSNQLPGAAQLSTKSPPAGKGQRWYLRLGAWPVPP